MSDRYKQWFKTNSFHRSTHSYRTMHLRAPVYFNRTSLLSGAKYPCFFSVVKKGSHDS